MKKSLLPIISILTMSFTSALSFSDMLNQIDSSLIWLSAIFILAFLFINFSLSKIFKEQKNIATIMSIVLSFLIVFGINRLEIDVPSFFFDLGISEDFFLTIVPLILLAGIIFLFVKLPKGKKKYLFYIVGGFLVAVGFFIFEEAAQLVVLGIALIVFGFIIVPILNFLKSSLAPGKNNSPRTNVTSTH
jgi:hypothetical protein